VASTCQPATARALGCRAQATPNAVAHARPRTALADGGGAGRRRGHQETSSKVSAEEATNRQLVRVADQHLQLLQLAQQRQELAETSGSDPRT
jgi:hypothetical protein